MKRDFSLTGFMVSCYLIFSILFEMIFFRSLALVIIAPTYIKAAGGSDITADLPHLQSVVDSVTAGPVADYISAIPRYLLAIPLVLKLFNGTVFNADDGTVKRDLSIKEMACAFLCLFSMGVVGNILGQLGAVLFGIVSGQELENALVTKLSHNSYLLIFLFTVMITPAFEEIMYRYGVISRIRKYGEYNAVLVSALIFALMHRNIFQFFYTFSAGIVFGYVYTYTGKLRYSIILHIMFNFFGAFLPILISPDGSADGIIAKMYLASEYIVCVAGILLIIYMVRKKKFLLKVSENAAIKGIIAGDAVLNFGMVSLLFLCMAYMFI